MTRSEFKSRYQGYRTLNPLGVACLGLLMLIFTIPLSLVVGLYKGFFTGLHNVLDESRTVWGFFYDWWGLQRENFGHSCKDNDCQSHQCPVCASKGLVGGK